LLQNYTASYQETVSTGKRLVSIPATISTISRPVDVLLDVFATEPLGGGVMGVVGGGVHDAKTKRPANQQTTTRRRFEQFMT
jgi:hypothetical protein